MPVKARAPRGVVVMMIHDDSRFSLSDATIAALWPPIIFIVSGSPETATIIEINCSYPDGKN